MKEKIKLSSPAKLFWGIVFVIFSLSMIFNFPFFCCPIYFPWQFWPIALIVVGVFFMLNKKSVAFSMIFLMLILGIFSGIAHFGGYDKENGFREFEQDFSLENVSKVYLNVDYGIGDLMISRSDEDKISYYVTTYDLESPRVQEDWRENNTKRIYLSRVATVNSLNSDENVWDIKLGDSVKYNLVLGYGVSDVYVDLRGLEVDNLKMSGGMSDTEVILEAYPTHIKADSGVSDIVFKFPEGMPVMIDYDGGLSSKNFVGFIRDGRKYYSENYDEDSEAITIDIDSGVSSLYGEFY